MSEVTTEPGASSAPASPLARYERSMRRKRTVYYAVLAVVVVVFGTIFVVVWATGEAAHTTLHTANAQPADLPLAPASATQNVAWRTSDRAADGTPQWHGTVITYSTHTVSGRNARTGARTWSYNRSDRTVCDALQIKGTTVAVYDRDGTCDEVSAFDSGTGRRSWSRTLDEDGKPLQGRPTYQFTDGQLLIVSPTVLYDISLQGNPGVDVWTYARYGCTIDHAVLGSAGALISQNCSAAVQCTGLSFCRAGRQLLLRNGTAGNSDTDKKNPDVILWDDFGNTGVPVSADALISAVQPGSNVLDVLGAKDGKQAGTVQLDPAPTSLSGIVARATASAELIWIDGHLTAVPNGGTAALWSVATSSAPSLAYAGDAAAVDELPQLSASRLTVPAAEGIATLDPTTGGRKASYATGASAAGSTVSPLGTGFLVASPSGTVAYR